MNYLFAFGIAAALVFTGYALNQEKATFGATPVTTVPQGGTGQSAFALGAIPIGGGVGLPGSLRFSTSSALTFATSSATLTVTNLTVGGTCTGCSGSGGAYPFTPATNFGVTAQATTGIAWFQNGLQASSTSQVSALTISGGISSTPFVVASSNGNAYSAFNAPAASIAGLLLESSGTVTWGIIRRNTSNNFAIQQGGAGADIVTISATSPYNLGIASTTPFSALSVGTGAASSSVTVAEYKYGKAGNIATSTAATIDCRTSNQIAWPLGSAATTLTLTGLTPGSKCIVVTQNPNGTAGALTWAAAAGYTLKWAGGTLPTQTTTANAMDIWSFLVTQGSSTIEIIGAATTNN